MRKLVSVILLIVLTFTGIACAGKKDSASRVQVGSKRKAVMLSLKELRRIKPNELGSIMVLEYHDIGSGDGEYCRSSSDFKKDLERLYNSGFRPISLHDFLDGYFELEPGLTPFILTFDDSTPGQFRFIEQGDMLAIDPKCAVGIMKGFSLKHRDFPMKACFFVLYGCAPIHRLFAQPGYASEKLRFIVKEGMEVGNHTYSHGFLNQLSTDVGMREIARACICAREMIPGYTVDVLALPGGGMPENAEIIRRGHYQRTTYENRASLMAFGGPTKSPFSRMFDPYKILRVVSTEKQIDYWLNYYEKYPEKKFISDGNPNVVTVPAQKAKDVKRKALGNGGLRVY